MKLRDFLQATRQARGGRGAALPVGELRFVLEYRTPPDATAEAAAIAQILGTDDFQLRNLFGSSEGDLARFLVLRFPGFERTQPNVSDLFDMAYELANARDLVSCEPDLGDSVYRVPEAPGSGPRREEALGFSCWVDKSAPSNKNWALDKAGVLRAWETSRTFGLGVLVGQPDTGVAFHTEIERGALRLDLAANILDGSADPTDPLNPDVANPGHGTGTASVVASRTAGQIAGAAPRAELVPIRCIDDVKVIDASPVAAAIDHARRAGCHIITMSLGGFGSRSMAAAIDRAVAENAIVLAAAGNCVGIVVYPARYSSVIAVAGTNIDDVPWKGTCQGSAVDISAPGELVWRADRRLQTEPADKVSGGQGTSFAVALVAGIAALWLSHHGRAAVMNEANRRGVTVQTLFKTALKATARVPIGWRSDLMGAGVVDAGALLGMALDAIPAAMEAAPAASDLPDDILAETGIPQADIGQDSRGQFGLELRRLAMEDALATVRSVRLGAEGVATDLRLSERLRAAAPGFDRAWAARHAGSASIEKVRPRAPYVVAEHARPISLVPLLGRSRGGRGPGMESAARQALTPSAVKERVTHLQRALDRLEKANPGNTDLPALKAEILTQAEPALNKLRDHGRAADLSQAERASFEALVQLTERPVVRVRHDAVTAEDTDLEGWQEKVALHAPDFMPLLKSVGRIDAHGTHIGTGFVVGSGLVMTNRHVIEAFATPVPRRTSPARWIVPPGQVTIGFADDGTSAEKRFKVSSVVFAGPDPIEEIVNFSHLDMALLEVETRNDGGLPLPTPIPLIREPNFVARGSDLFVVGFPAEPASLPRDSDGKFRRDVLDRLRKLYGSSYGVKYFAPGEIDSGMGELESDVRHWIVSHDASTLAGNSGSCIVHFAEPFGVIGLHFAGDWLRANYAHGVAAAIPSGGLPLPVLDNLVWA